MLNINNLKVETIHVWTYIIPSSYVGYCLIGLGWIKSLFLVALRSFTKLQMVICEVISLMNLERSSIHQGKNFNMLLFFAGLKNPITLMSYVTPVMTVTTAISSLMLDPWHNLSKNKYFNNSSHIVQSCLLMLLGGALAFFMVRVYTKILLVR